MLFRDYQSATPKKVNILILLQLSHIFRRSVQRILQDQLFFHEEIFKIMDAQDKSLCYFTELLEIEFECL